MINQVIDFLRGLKPGQLPPELFYTIASLTVTPILEIVPLRRAANGTVEVLLFKREASDPIWGGLLHTPGTVIRASDQPGTFNDAFRRLLSGEMAGINTGNQPQFVETIFHQVKRGRELAMIYWVSVAGEATGSGTWYPLTGLPDQLVDSQRSFIERAANDFTTKTN